MTKKWICVATMASVLALTGCETNKQNLGTLGGAALGGLLGSQVGKGKGKIIATAAGVFVGGVIGNQIGKYLDDRDKQLRDEALAKAINKKEKISWKNPSSGKSGTVAVKSLPKREDTKKIKVAKKLKTVPPIEAVGETYEATSGANVRGGPSTDYEVVDRINKGQVVTAMGRVKGKRWYLIGQKQGQQDVGTGYVHGNLIKRAPTATRAPTSAPLDPNQVEEKPVSVASECVQATDDVSLGGGKTTQGTVTLCKGPNGWEKV